MQTALNILTFSRAPLAMLFLFENWTVRLIAVILAMVTDSIDGWLARRYRSTSRFGAILDPAMDKFFVYFVLSVLLVEHQLPIWCALAMVSRDWSLVLYAIFLLLTRQFRTSEFRSIIWGKVSTALQFSVLIAICLKLRLPHQIYYAFLFLSSLALIELFYFQFKKLTLK
ncbi:MAG: CDP-alcohol phosphatidyltransferase family protein [Rhabdochlamydiaceae bacterium]|nr:CDP-alcohol phosphatidyltransferase family protein [Candidatus Amphrikana amoebophyrae]